MSDAPVLKRLLILRDERLPFIDLDLTDPETGSPLGEICLIGPNACGKSTLLARLHEAMTGRPRWMELGEAYFLAKWRFEDEDLYFAKPFGGGEGLCFRPAIESSSEWTQLGQAAPAFEDLRTLFAADLVLEASPGFGSISSLWCDPEHCLVDGESPGDLTAFLELSLHERQEAFHRFLRAPENRDKTVAEVEETFEATSPQALPHLREAWNRLLAPSGFYVELVGDEARFMDRSGSSVAMDRLGSSMRQALLQVGLAASHPATNLFLDEAGEGWHPVLALDLLPLFRSLAAAQGERRFIATHCPLVASRFAPASRIRFTQDEEGALALVRSTAPADAPITTILEMDFGVIEAAPAASATAPIAPAASNSSRLKRAIRESDNEEELADLIDEVMSIRKS
jgi:energy-coupling factor transporter ATP-binding protein EcfA2